MQDQISATELAYEAYEKLKKIEPDHELVKIMEPGPSDEEFVNRFWDKEEPWQDQGKGSMVTMYVEGKYFVAVRDYLEKEYGVGV